MSSTATTQGNSALTAGGYATLIVGGGGGAMYAVDAQKKLNKVNSELVDVRTPHSDQATISRTDLYVRNSTTPPGVGSSNQNKMPVRARQMDLRLAHLFSGRFAGTNPVGYAGVDRNAGAFRTLRKAKNHAKQHRQGMATGFREQNGRIVLVNLDQPVHQLRSAPSGINPRKPGPLAFMPSDANLLAVTDSRGNEVKRISTGSKPLMLKADTFFHQARNRWVGAGAAVLTGYALLNAGAPKAVEA